MEHIKSLLMIGLAILLLSSCPGKRDSKEGTEQSNTSYGEVSSPGPVWDASQIQKFEISEFDRLPEKRGLLADHYPSSNEMRIDMFRPHLEKLGGAYLGVGTDQNFTFIAWAKSDCAWLMDFDPVIVSVNKIHLLFIEHSPTYADYRQLWSRSRDQRKKSLQLVKDRYAKTAEWNLIYMAWRTATRGYNDVPARLDELDRMGREFGLNSFHNDPEDYAFLRKMVLEKRIQAIPGDLTATVSVQSVARAAKSLKIPVRVVYTSNAEEYFLFPPNFRNNIIALPTDEKSLLVRTVTNAARSYLGFPDGEKYPEEFPFHYNLQPLENLKKWMSLSSPLKVAHMIRFGKTLEKGFSFMDKTPEEAGVVSVNSEGK